MSIAPQVSGSYLHGRQPETCRSREKVAGEVREALARLDMILEVLEELEKPPVPAAGDPDLRRGCERAMTSILSALAKLAPAETPSEPPGPVEETVMRKLNGERISRLVDGDMLACLWTFIVRILPPSVADGKQAGH